MRPHLFVVCLGVLLECALLTAIGHPAPGDESDAARGEVPDYQYDVADVVVRPSILEEPLWYDADIALHRGAVWITWLEFTPEQGDQIWVGTRNGGSWQQKARVSEAPGEYAHPTLTVDSEDRIWLSYEARRGDQWDVFVMQLAETGGASAARQVSPGGGADINHAVAADHGGGLWFAWQSDQAGQFDIVTRRVTADSMDRVDGLGDGHGGCWHPSVAVDASDRVYVAWDAHDGRAFNVQLRVLRGGFWRGVVDVARSAAFEGRAVVACGNGDGAFVAWEVGGEDWGRPFRGVLSTHVHDHHGPLHRHRQIKVAHISAEGAVTGSPQPLPMPAVERAAKRTGIAAESRRVGAFYERPRLCVDHSGRLWIAYRHFYAPWLGISHRSHIEQGFAVYTRCLTDRGWSDLYRMDVGQGDGMQRLELAAEPHGIRAVWTTGRTHRDDNDRPRGIVTASCGDVDGTLDPSGWVAEPPQDADARPTARSRQLRPQLEVGDQRYLLLFGDLHRHTDLSLCRVPVDGTIDDAYRYASEVAQLDFLGITDHTRDIAKGDPLSQLWWRCRKEVYRHQLGNPAAASFLPFYAYERSHGNTADHNVISLRPDMLRPYTYPVPEFWKELDHDTITIPHQPIRRDTWAYQDDRRRPLVEIFQGARDQSIEDDIYRGLAKGYHLGFIASSDHMSTSASYVCVWAEEASRESIFRALQGRRTYAATDRIRLSLRAGEHWMGEVIRAAEMPELVLEARGTAAIETVELILDGQVVETRSPLEESVAIRRKLKLSGTHYMYYHLVQTDGNEAWSSPIWFEFDADAD